MKDNWKQLKRAITQNIKGRLENDANFNSLDIEKTLDLFKKILVHKTGRKGLDGLNEPISDAITEVYISQTGSVNACRSLVTNIEPYLKKILFLISNCDTSEDKQKNLAFCLKELNLLSRDHNNKTPQLDEASLSQYIGASDFLYDICKTYIERNNVHRATTLTLADKYKIVESSLIVYLFAVVKNYEKLNHALGDIKNESALIENYKNRSLAKLEYNLSLKMLESDFGIKIQVLDEFEVVVKAKAKRLGEEKEKYLSSDISSHTPIMRLLPELKGVLSNSKFILLHGIATSGKSTILKKLGKDFLESFDSPYLFYLELGEIFKKKNGKSLLQEALSEYKEATSSDLDFSAVTEKIFFLLDGLDEVPVNEVRDEIIDQIIDLKKHKNIQVVLTSRTNDYITNNQKVDAYFEKFELLPIGLGDIIKIGEKIIGQGSQFSNFVRLIKKNNLFKAFPKTPLTSILLAIIFKDSEINLRELPKNVTELYKKFIDLFLNRWDRSKGISEQFEIQKKEFVLQTIAMHMQKNKLISITANDLEKLISELLETHPIGKSRNPKEHLQNICDRTGILIKDEWTGMYRFFHLTIQEYLAAQKFDHRDEELLITNFYDERWVNTNIFYAGIKPDYPEILNNISSLKYYPSDAESKFNYFVHSAHVLLAAHNVDNNVRHDMLKSMLKIFDEFSKEFIHDLLDISINPAETNRLSKLRNHSLLDVILILRGVFMEFFSFSDFQEQLKKIWSNIVHSNTSISICDITLYSLSYCLSINSKDAEFLEDFVITDSIDINPRWFRIIEVDILVKKLTYTNKKIKLKIKNVSNKNSKYIDQQFKERLKRHYNSIFGIK